MHNKQSNKYFSRTKSIGKSLLYIDDVTKYDHVFDDACHFCWLNIFLIENV